MADLLSIGVFTERVLQVNNSATTLVLTNAVAPNYQFFGLLNQTVQLPNAATCANGQHYYFANRSSGTVTITYNDTTTLVILPPSTAVKVLLFSNGTSNGTWDSDSPQNTSTTASPTFAAMQLNGYLDVIEQSSSPTAPAAGALRLFSQTGDTLAYENSAGLVTQVGSSIPAYSIQTSNYAAVSGNNIIADTSAGSFTITLPATPSFNNRVVIVDGSGTFATNNLIVANNGSNIGGINGSLYLNVNNTRITFFYYNSTQGWIFW